MTFVLPNLGPRVYRPFVAVWVEDETGRLVKLVTLWGVKSEWYKELTTFWTLTKGEKELLFPVTRPTRSPGRYQLLWDGRDTQGRPVPRGTYRIVIEVNRERGTYTKRVATIVCGDEPAGATVEPTANWESLSITYRPKAITGVKKHPFRTIARWALTLHIYVSMAGFLLLFFFAVTGITLNHADFGLSEPQLETLTIAVPPTIMDRPAQETLSEHLRRELGVSSPLTLYREYPEEIEMQFAAPGERAQVLINRMNAAAQVELVTRGWLGKMGDLHKGLDSGRLWFWIIDITAVLFVITSLTGMISLAALPSRRRVGFIVGLVGVALSVAVYVIWVPK